MKLKELYLKYFKEIKLSILFLLVITFYDIYIKIKESGINIGLNLFFNLVLLFLVILIIFNLLELIYIYTSIKKHTKDITLNKFYLLMFMLGFIVKIFSMGIKFIISITFDEENFLGVGILSLFEVTANLIIFTIIGSRSMVNIFNKIICYFQNKRLLIYLILYVIIYLIFLYINDFLIKYNEKNIPLAVIATCLFFANLILPILIIRKWQETFYEKYFLKKEQ